MYVVKKIAKHLDVRRIPSKEWHQEALRAFDMLGYDEELQIVSCHDLRPLRTRLAYARPAQYAWSEHLMGANHWITRVTRMREASATLEDFMRRCPIFSHASAQTLRTLEGAATEDTWRLDEPVVEQDAGWDAFGLVRTGKVAAIVTSPEGREHTLYESLPGEAFGEMPSIDGGMTALRFVAKSDTARLILFRRCTVEAALARDAALSRSVNTLLAQRVRIIVERFAAQTTRPTVARVAEALLPHVPPGPGLQDLLASARDLTHREIANAAGTVKEVVCRALAELEGRSAIQRSNGRIVRANRERLMLFAQVV